MMLLKGCPKCRGDVIADRDLHGRYIRCLQCGYMKDVAEDFVLSPREAEPARQPEPAEEMEAA